MQMYLLSSSTQNLAEIQTYVNILQQINQTLPLVPNVSLGTSEVSSRVVVTASTCVCVLLREQNVFALDSVLATCLGLMRRLTSVTSQLKCLLAFVCVSLFVCVFACEKRRQLTQHKDKPAVLEDT